MKRIAPRIDPLCPCGCPPHKHRNHGEGGYCFHCKRFCAPFDPAPHKGVKR